jgi:hypothetical protein
MASTTKSRVEKNTVIHVGKDIGYLLKHHWQVSKDRIHGVTRVMTDGPWQPPGKQMPPGCIPGMRAMVAGGVGANHRAIRETARDRRPLTD